MKKIPRRILWLHFVLPLAQAASSGTSPYGVVCGKLQTRPSHFPAEASFGATATERLTISTASFAASGLSQPRTEVFEHILLVIPTVPPTLVLANGKALTDPTRSLSSRDPSMPTTTAPTQNVQWLIEALVPQQIGQPLCLPGVYGSGKTQKDHILITVPYLGFLCGDKTSSVIAERTASGVISQYTYSMKSPVFCTLNQTDCGPVGGDLDVVVPSTMVTSAQRDMLLSDPRGASQRNCWRGAFFPKAFFVVAQ